MVENRNLIRVYREICPHRTLEESWVSHHLNLVLDMGVHAALPSTFEEPADPGRELLPTLLKSKVGKLVC